MTLTLGELNSIAGLVAAGFAVIGAAALWWLSKSFASKGAFDALAAKHATMEERLNRGEARFIAMEGAIKEVTHAAEEAREAAERAMAAAEKVDDTRVELARVGERITALTELLKRVDEDARLLRNGHLALGGK